MSGKQTNTGGERANVGDERIFPAYDSAIGDIPPRGPAYSFQPPRRSAADVLAAALSGCRPSSLSRLPVDYQPGDLIFFAGHDPLSRAISYRTCTWRQLFAAPFNGGFLPSHVAICCDYADPVSKPDRLSRVLMVESTTMNDRPCFVTGMKICGVQAHLPAPRVGEYPGKVWRLRLRRPLGDGERQELSAFLLSQLGKPYNYRRAAALGEYLWHRAAAACDPLPDTWFCDELAIEALKCVNRVGVDNDPESFSPATFARLVLHSGEYYGLSQVGSPSFRIK